jgi:hypothetical protein
MGLISIIWNYFDEIPVEILTTFNQLSNIGRVDILALNELMPQFINDVYSIEEIKPEYVARKIDILSHLPKKAVLVIYHDLPGIDLQERPSDLSAIQFIKHQIRDLYDSAYQCAKHNPIIHTTDNWRQGELLEQLLVKYYRANEVSSVIDYRDWLSTKG